MAKFDELLEDIHRIGSRIQNLPTKEQRKICINEMILAANWLLNWNKQFNKGEKK